MRHNSNFFAMRIDIPEKLTAIAAQIKQSGSAELTRLTVLKKWFEQNENRLSSFAIFIAKRAAMDKEKTGGEASILFREARALLKEADVYDPQLSQKAAEDLYRRLNAFQSEYKKLRWGPVRIIHNYKLFLIDSFDKAEDTD